MKELISIIVQMLKRIKKREGKRCKCEPSSTYSDWLIIKVWLICVLESWTINVFYAKLRRLWKFCPAYSFAAATGLFPLGRQIVNYRALPNTRYQMNSRQIPVYKGRVKAVAMAYKPAIRQPVRRKFPLLEP
jgi:hypothetical protein